MYSVFVLHNDCIMFYCSGIQISTTERENKFNRICDQKRIVFLVEFPKKTLLFSHNDSQHNVNLTNQTAVLHDALQFQGAFPSKLQFFSSNDYFQNGEHKLNCRPFSSNTQYYAHTVILLICSILNQTVQYQGKAPGPFLRLRTLAYPTNSKVTINTLITKLVQPYAKETL